MLCERRRGSSEEHGELLELEVGGTVVSELCCAVRSSVNFPSSDLDPNPKQRIDTFLAPSQISPYSVPHSSVRPLVYSLLTTPRY